MEGITFNVAAEVYSFSQLTPQLRIKKNGTLQQKVITTSYNSMHLVTSVVERWDDVPVVEDDAE